MVARAKTGRAKHNEHDPNEPPKPKEEAPYGSEVVTVACKLPNGLLLRLHDLKETTVPTSKGFEAVRQWVPVGEAVKIRGYRGVYHDPTVQPKIPIIGGYALTIVPRSFWEAWLEQNKTSYVVTAKLIWAHYEQASVKSWAKEHTEISNGLEPIDPSEPSSALNFRRKNLRLEPSEVD